MKMRMFLKASVFAFIFLFVVGQLIKWQDNKIGNNEKNIAVAQAILKGDKVRFESVSWVRDMLSLSSSYEKSLLNARLTEKDILLLKKGNVCVQFNVE